MAAALCTAGFAGVAGVRLLAFRCRFSRRLHGFRVNRGPFKAAVRRTGDVRRQRSWILRRVFMPRGRRRCHSVIITRPLNPGPGRSLHDRHSAARQHLQNWVICVHPAARPTVKATDAASSLSGAQAIVANIRSAVATCQQGYIALQQWVVRDNAYQAALALARKQHKPPKGIQGRVSNRPGRRCASLPPRSASRLMPSSRPLGPREQHQRPVARLVRSC